MATVSPIEPVVMGCLKLLQHTPDDDMAEFPPGVTGAVLYQRLVPVSVTGDDADAILVYDSPFSPPNRTPAARTLEFVNTLPEELQAIFHLVDDYIHENEGHNDKDRVSFEIALVIRNSFGS